MAEAMVRQIGPTLERLAPLAWHRDVNSHNVLVSDRATGKLLNQEPDDYGHGAQFWLIDLGLAVDSRSWVASNDSQGGTWRVTDIGGDCRYWPASSWMVHLYGADFLAEREDFCRQYQWRLDSFGLGITAVELICSTALAARLAGAPPVDCNTVSEVCWARLLDAWQRYYDKAGNWWVEIYKVFSRGGDFRPVHAWLCEEQVADQVVSLMEDLREGLRACMECATDEASARVLRIVAELIDEASEFELVQLCSMFPKQEEVVPQIPASSSSAQAPVSISQDVAPEDVSQSNGLSSSAASAQQALPTAAVQLLQTGEMPEVLEPASSSTSAAPSALPTQAPPMVSQPAASTGASPEEMLQEAALFASAENSEGRQVVASLAPIPPIAAVGGQAAAAKPEAQKDRQAELSELVDAQAQLRHDLERLQVAKLRLQQARRVHEEKKQNAAMAAVTNAASGAAQATNGAARAVAL